MRYISCFSGIEAASLAFLPLGWECLAVAEIEKFPCAVLAHHYPNTPNLGSVLAEDFISRVVALKPDVLVAGPPCQDFSIAGLRAGIEGERGNLTLTWVRIINAVQPRYAITENVPGWLSINGGAAFGAFLAGLVGHDSALVPPKECGGRWTDAGMVDGPQGRCAWRVLNAQHFRLAQRRRRVFVVFCPRNGGNPAAVLFERESLRRDITPSREAREEVAPTIRAGAANGGAGHGARSGDSKDKLIIPTTAPTLPSHNTSGGGMGTDFDCDGGLIPSLSRCVTAREGQRQDYAAETMVVAIPINTQVALRHKALGEGTGFGVGSDGDPAFTLQSAHSHAVAHTLRAKHDASEDGTGRGTPLITSIRLAQTSSNGCGIDESGLCYTLDGANGQAGAFHMQASSSQSMNPSQICPALDKSKIPAVAGFKGGQGSKAGSIGYEEEMSPTLGAADSGSNRTPLIFKMRGGCEGGGKGYLGQEDAAFTVSTGKDQNLLHNMGIRRLTPDECEKLQGFPPGYTQVPYRGKPAADGPRYKALGNSFAVPIVSWIGNRIQMVEGSLI